MSTNVYASIIQDAQRSIKDPIHDLIEVTNKMSLFIDTRQFQRLRSIKQLGTSYYVWPGASHNRFEHCLGVAHLAQTLVTTLKLKQPELGITDRDVECVVLAALCHDLGHGPWSHVWDNMFMPAVLPDRPWKHEQGSELMLDHLIATNKIEMAPADVLFIKDLIAGEKTRCEQSEKKFLFDIVANKRNGLDVDRWDYFVRDSHMIGEPIKINLRRLLNSARVIGDEICFDIKDINNIYEIYNTRFRLHKTIYNHKTAKAIEYMIIDGLKAAQKHTDIASKVFDPKLFTFLTDDIMAQIEYQAETDNRFSEARAIFDRIKNRDLYKSVDYKVVAWADKEIFERCVTSERIVEEAKEDYVNNAHNNHAMDVDNNRDDDESDVLRQSYPLIDPVLMTPDDVIVSLSPMHYGMMDENPILKVKFYSKSRPNVALTAQPGDYSSLMPSVFGEYMLRVYTKEPKYFYNVQAGYRAILRKMNPEVVELPSTPRQQTRSFGRTVSAGSFDINQFTTVRPAFCPPGTPSKKRTRKGDDEEMVSPRKKKT